jgi:OOP family OmpA-OmpF porin
MRNFTLITGLAMCVALSSVSAQTGSGVYVNPKASVAEFARTTLLDNEALYGFGVGYRFSGPVALEGSYVFDISSVENRAGTSAEIDVWDISVLYHFLESERVSPVIGLGYGEQDISLAGQGKESQMNAGLGLRWRLFRDVDARAQYSFYDGADAGGLDRIFNVGLQYHFGAKPIEAPPVIDADNDNDGVRDSQDNCLGTPANRPVDARGCLVRLDSDRDGVDDAQDQCPGTDDRSRKIDASGCYVPEMVTTTEQMDAVFYFDFDSAEIRLAHEAKAQQIARFLEGGRINTIRLAGHTDSSGPNAYNQKLAKERVDAVQKLLEQVAGLTDGEVQKASYGENNPAVSNESNAASGVNRRVEAVIRTEKQSLRQ